MKLQAETCSFLIDQRRKRKPDEVSPEEKIPLTAVIFEIEDKKKTGFHFWKPVLALTYLPGPSPDKYFRHR